MVLTHNAQKPPQPGADFENDEPQGKVCTITTKNRLARTHCLSRSFFKKWLESERRIGDEEGADAVKAKAIEWTQRAAGTSET